MYCHPSMHCNALDVCDFRPVPSTMNGSDLPGLPGYLWDSSRSAPDSMEPIRPVHWAPGRQMCRKLPTFRQDTEYQWVTLLGTTTQLLWDFFLKKQTNWHNYTPHHLCFYFILSFIFDLLTCKHTLNYFLLCQKCNIFFFVWFFLFEENSW